jgi:hypothetical protein
MTDQTAVERALDLIRTTPVEVHINREDTRRVIEWVERFNACNLEEDHFHLPADLSQVLYVLVMSGLDHPEDMEVPADDERT